MASKKSPTVAAGPVATIASEEQSASEVLGPGAGSLPKGLAILEVLAASGEPAGVSEIARELNMGKSGVHRLLRILCGLGWVREAAHSRYECTLRIWEVGMRVADRVDLRGMAASHMRMLATLTQETVHLSILDGTDVLYLDKIDSPQPVRAYSRIGGRAPAACVATGKALLAWADEARVAQVQAVLQPYTPKSIVTARQLDTELQRIRAQGYAINHGEWRASVCGLAAPVFDARAQAVAAIGISGPAERLSPKVLKAFMPHVLAAARALSADLGFAGQAL